MNLDDHYSNAVTTLNQILCILLSEKADTAKLKCIKTKLSHLLKIKSESRGGFISRDGIKMEAK